MAHIAIGVLSCWVAVMALIWLCLPGALTIASGFYSAIEIVLTVIIAFCSISGIVKCVPTGRLNSHRQGIILLCSGLGMQAAWVMASVRFID
jgi:hypothetical protein